MDPTMWLQSMGAVRVGDRGMGLGQPFGGVYPISYLPAARGGIWWLFGVKVEGQLTQPQCAQILQHIGM